MITLHPVLVTLAVACAVALVAGTLVDVPALSRLSQAQVVLPQPQGSYCGRYSIVHARAIFNASRRVVTLILKPMLGSSIVCEDVAYAFDAVSGSLVIPAAADPTSCVGAALARANMQRAVAVVFDAIKNQLSFQSGAVNVELSPCV
jgi:hypothetical protein